MAKSHPNMFILQDPSVLNPTDCKLGKNVRQSWANTCDKMSLPFWIFMFLLLVKYSLVLKSASQPVSQYVCLSVCVSVCLSVCRALSPYLPSLSSLIFSFPLLWHLIKRLLAKGRVTGREKWISRQNSVKDKWYQERKSSGADISQEEPEIANI